MHWSWKIPMKTDKVGVQTYAQRHESLRLHQQSTSSCGANLVMRQLDQLEMRQSRLSMVYGGACGAQGGYR